MELAFVVEQNKSVTPEIGDLLSAHFELEEIVRRWMRPGRSIHFYNGVEDEDDDLLTGIVLIFKEGSNEVGEITAPIGDCLNYLSNRIDPLPPLETLKPSVHNHENRDDIEFYAAIDTRYEHDYHWNFMLCMLPFQKAVEVACWHAVTLGCEAFLIWPSAEVTAADIEDWELDPSEADPHRVIHVHYTCGDKARRNAICGSYGTVAPDNV